jgi:hypothetical protein
MRLGRIGALAAWLVLSCHSAPVRLQATGSAAPTSGASAAPAARELVYVTVAGPGRVVVHNDGDAPVRIAWDMPIERADGGAWKPIHALHPMTKCFEPPPADGCVAVPPRATLSPRPWTGWFGCTQCGTCRGNVRANPGTYRVVARECDSGREHASPPMEIVEPGRFAHTLHVHADAGAPNVIVVDNESDVPVSLASDVTVEKLDPRRNAYDAAPDTKLRLSPGAAACTTVAPHATLRTGALVPARPGTYLLAVRVCDPAKPLYNDVYGVSFAVPPFVFEGPGRVRAAP